MRVPDHAHHRLFHFDSVLFARPPIMPGREGGIKHMAPVSRTRCSA
jgi:hypothetical protein